MNKLIDHLIESVNLGNIWVGFIMLAIIYVLKKEPFKIFAHFSERKSKDIDQALNLLESEKLTKESNELIKEYIEKYTFKKYYGIYANKEMRSALLKFYQKHQNDISWYDLKIAYSLYKLDGSKIKIILNWKNHLGRWSVTILSWFVSLFALLVIVIAFFTYTENQLKFVGLTFSSLLLFVGALLFSSLNESYHSVKKINACNE